MLSKTNNVPHTNSTNLTSQENQDYDNRSDQQLMTYKHDCGVGYYNQSDPQFITYKHNSGLQQVNTELVPDIFLEEKEEWF